MSRDNESLVDIVQAIQKILRFTQGVDQNQFETNEEKQSATLYQIMIVGEAVKRLSPEFRSQHSDIPWKNIAGMRNVLTHQYDEIDLNVMWDVIQLNIPQLLAMLEPLLPIQETE
jgi:uncharacterized protein with HEPN domain